MSLMPNEFKDVDTNPDPESTVNALGAMSQLASVLDCNFPTKQPE